MSKSILSYEERYRLYGVTAQEISPLLKKFESMSAAFIKEGIEQYFAGMTQSSRLGEMMQRSGDKVRSILTAHYEALFS